MGWVRVCSCICAPLFISGIIKVSYHPGKSRTMTCRAEIYIFSDLKRTYIRYDGSCRCFKTTAGLRSTFQRRNRAACAAQWGEFTELKPCCPLSRLLRRTSCFSLAPRVSPFLRATPCRRSPVGSANDYVTLPSTEHYHAATLLPAIPLAQTQCLLLSRNLVLLHVAPCRHSPIGSANDYVTLPSTEHYSAATLLPVIPLAQTHWLLLSRNLVLLYVAPCRRSPVGSANDYVTLPSTEHYHAATLLPVIPLAQTHWLLLSRNLVLLYVAPCRRSPIGSV
jgi:hypothetical protein